MALLGLVVLVNIKQPYPSVAPLHHIPTVLIVLATPWWLKRWPLSNAALASAVGFLALHTIAARWTYTMVPYDAWAQALTGGTVNGLFGWERNHFDRLVHFAFGAFAVLPVMEWLERLGGVSRRLAAYLVVEFVLGASAAYELVEWGLSLTLAPDAVEAYNGQQGDMWDAHKDMALATLGAIISLIINSIIVRHDRGGRETRHG